MKALDGRSKPNPENGAGPPTNIAAEGAVGDRRRVAEGWDGGEKIFGPVLVGGDGKWLSVKGLALFGCGFRSEKGDRNRPQNDQKRRGNDRKRHVAIRGGARVGEDESAVRREQGSDAGPSVNAEELRLDIRFPQRRAFRTASSLSRILTNVKHILARGAL